MTRADSIVLVNTGHGKGKSSAAFGVMGRGWARGWRVGVVQFIKGGKWKTGERKLADHLGIEWHTLGDGFTWESTDLDETAAKGRHAWEVARDKLPQRRLRPAHPRRAHLRREVRLGARWPRWWRRSATGRPTPTSSSPAATPPRRLVDVADTVTEMRKVKHAYDQGIKAKKGIEY